MDRSGLTRGTRWCQTCSPSLSSSEVIHEKTLPQKTIFLSLETSRTYSIRLAANLKAQIDSGDTMLSFGCLTILLANTVIEIITIFCENSPILRKFDLFLPPVTSNFTWSKNDLRISCRTCHGLSNAVHRFSLSFIVFELSGGAVIRPPLPCEGGSDPRPYAGYRSWDSRGGAESALPFQGAWFSDPFQCACYW